MVSVAIATLLFSMVLPLHTEGSGDARLYGRVTTTDGRVVEGWLRWDRNEASRNDFLDGAREISREVLREAERLDPQYGEEMRRKRSLVAFGVRITWSEDDLAPPPTVPVAVRMSRIAEIRPLEGRRAVVVLVGGEEVELVASSSDLGPGMRDVVVEPHPGSVATFEWKELARVELLLPPEGVEPPEERRLHGTVVTRSGMEFTGLVSWDLDEAFPSDVLDGRDDRGDIDIPFVDIRAIEPVDDRSARVMLRSGGERILRGTNDVDRRNRGVEVVDASLGRVVVAWEELARVELHDPVDGLDGPDGGDAPIADPDVSASAPDRSKAPAPPGQSGALRGTVFARDGRTLSGALRWGHDEEREWELLDGRLDGALVGIELASIREIRPDGPDGALVVLRDGRTVRLHGTDDVGQGHRGVFVTPEGRARRLVRWADVERVVLGS